MIEFTSDNVLTLNNALCKWGKEAQLMMAIEEMAELTKELAKYFRDGKNETEIQEEVADVFITVLQVAMMFDYNQINDEIAFKMKRLKDRLEEVPPLERPLEKG